MTFRRLAVLFVALLLTAPGAVAQKPDDTPDNRPDPEDDPRGERGHRGNESEETNRSGDGEEDEPRESEDTGRDRSRDREDEEDESDEDDDASGQGRGRGRGRGGDDAARPEWAGPADDREGRERAAAARSVRDTLGAFSVAGSTAEGKHVSFTWSADAVTNAEAGGLPLFNAFAWMEEGEDEDDGTEVRAEGAQIRVETPHFEVRVHDNPGAVFKLKDADGFTLVFPNGSTLATKDAQLRVRYPSNETALVLSEDAWVVNGTTAETTSGVTFMLHARAGGFDKHRDAIVEAVAQRDVGAEVTVARSGNGSASGDAITFHNVTVETIADVGNVTLVVEGHGFDGRVVVMNVDPELFAAGTATDLRVLFDGQEIQSASSLLDALDPDDDGLHAEYWIVEDENGYQVIFSIPHYSVHTLSLLDAVKEVPPSVAIGLFASAIVVAAGAFVLFRRPGGAA